MNKPFNGISIVIPTFNEEANIKSLIERLNEAFSKAKITYELIFIDDNSTDNTQNEINKSNYTLDDGRTNTFLGIFIK